jgi:hypothetical protein
MLKCLLHYFDFFGWGKNKRIEMTFGASIRKFSSCTGACETERALKISNQIEAKLFQIKLVKYNNL